MKIAIAGSHGLIGTNLVTHFRKLNNNVTRIVRSKDQNGIYWDPRTGYINHENLDGYDVIINLCGEKIASLNPFFKNKNNLISSRVNTNLILSKTIAKLNNPPKFFITASATGIYKPSKRRITESSKFNQGFLAQLALEWEEASKFYSNDKTKIINLRLGQVISSDSFYFKAMSNISKYMKISSFGNGRQRWPWVSINDISKSIDFIIESNQIEGAVNVTNPNLLSCKEVLKTFSSYNNSFNFIRVPKIFIKLSTNTYSREILLNDYPVFPEKLLSSGFVFNEKNLENHLKNMN